MTQTGVLGIPLESTGPLIGLLKKYKRRKCCIGITSKTEIKCVNELNIMVDDYNLI